MGAGIWRFTEINRTPQRRSSSAGAEVGGESNTHWKRSPQTGESPQTASGFHPACFQMYVGVKGSGDVSSCLFHPLSFSDLVLLSVCLRWCLACPQVLLYSSLHLTRAVLSWLLDDDGQVIKELWKSVAWFRDTGHVCISTELCRLLFPDGASACLSVCDTIDQSFLK